jgi:valyl-tRNA synthetase
MAEVPVAGGGVVEVFAGNLVDPEKEARKRAEEADRVRGEIARAEGKLANDGFVAKAPAAVVDAERSKLERLRRELADLEAA